MLLFEIGFHNVVQACFELLTLLQPNPEIINNETQFLLPKWSKMRVYLTSQNRLHTFCIILELLKTMGTFTDELIYFAL